MSTDDARNPADQPAPPVAGDEARTTGVRDVPLEDTQAAPSSDPSPRRSKPGMGDLEPGTVLDGAYRVVKRLGGGAMGAVYLVEHLRLGRHFAAKVVAAAHADSAVAVARLQNEARVASSVQHENIVDVMHLGPTPDGSLFVVMELLEGHDLRHRLGGQQDLGPTRSLPDDEVRWIVRDVLAGLCAAHAAGIVHRDLKPDNVFLVHKGGHVRAKIVDFGISRITTAEEDLRLTRTGQIVGTPLYMAPEQTRHSDVDGRADLYSLGVIMYELVTGRLPFEATTMYQLMMKLATETPRAPCELRPDLLPRVSAVIMRCLEKQPAERYATAEELSRAWEDAWRDRPASVRPLALEATGSSSDEASASDPDAAPPKSGAPAESLAIAPPKRGSRAVIIITTLVGVGLAGWLGARAMRTPPTNHNHPRPAATAVVSPLRDPRAVLACPLLRTSGFAEPSGWLGAMAAAIMCDRARVILGGRYERTLVPAELLDLPRPPVDNFPAAPFDQPRALERSVAAARARAAAYFEGEVTPTNPGFRVVLRLMTQRGEEVAHAEGRGGALYQAVRAAMGPLVAQGALPKATQLDPEISEWTRATTIDGALALVDKPLADGCNDCLALDCPGLLSQGAAVRENAILNQFTCEGPTHMPSSTPPRVTLDDSSNATLRITAYTAYVLGDAATKRDAFERLERARATESSRLGKALMTAVQSALAQTVAPERALELAILAVELHSMGQDGNTASPSVQLASIHPAAQRAQMAWLPWIVEDFGGPETIEVNRRLAVLSPVYHFDLEAMLASGRTQDARRAALYLSTHARGDRQSEQKSEYSLVRIEAFEARFGVSLDRVASALTPQPGLATDEPLLQLAVIEEALHVARIIRDGEDWVDRHVLPLVDSTVVRSQMEALVAHGLFAAICARASAPRRGACFDRLRAMASDGRFPNDTLGTEGEVRGLESYAEGDYHAAALAWRPAIRVPSFGVTYLGNEMADAFDRTGELDLADRVDEILAAGKTYNGANLAHVRQARRAALRGHADEALALARKVIAAWSVADVPVPAVDEMRQLVARLEGQRPVGGVQR